MGGHLFTDGSGGTETKDPRLRRCGHGVAWILSNGGLLNTLGGIARILHGRNQSVARAELLAAFEALQLCEKCEKATQQIIIACLGSTASPEGDGRNTSPTLTCGKTSGRLMTSSPPPSLSSLIPHKVWRIHATEAEIAAGLISPLEAYGNEAADKLVARGALRNAFSMEYVAATRNTDFRVRLVQTKSVEINLIHVQNRPKNVRIKAKVPERRAKFDPDEAMSQLNRIGHDFSRVQIGKERFTYRCRRCFLRGERNFLKHLLGKPFSSRPCDALPLPAPGSVPTPDEPESFFIGDTASSGDDPFGWGGDFDHDHQAMSDHDSPFSEERRMDSADMDFRLSVDPGCGQAMDDAEPGQCASGIRDAPCDAVVQARNAQGCVDADVVVAAADSQGCSGTEDYTRNDTAGTMFEPRILQPWPLNRHLARSTCANDQDRPVVTKRNHPGSVRFTFHTCSVFVMRRFGSGDVAVGRRAADVHRD